MGYNQDMIKKILSTVMAAVLLAGCSAGSVSSASSASSEKESSYPKSDMSGYEGFTDENHVFVDMTVKEMAADMDAGKTFVVYFGFSNCPWCKEAMPVLNDTAKENDMKVGYINTRADSSWTSNTDIDDYDVVVERLSDYLEYDDDGKKHLYTPDVYFIKDGKVVMNHEGTLDGQNAKTSSLTDDETKELAADYQEGFDKLK
jgi:predicted bacteriocin transport accessory protein